MPARESGHSRWPLREPGPTREAAATAFRAEHPGATFRWDGMSGSPKWISAAPGEALSAPTMTTPEEVARGFLAAHGSLFGLSTDGVARLRKTSMVPAADGGTHVYFTQAAAGIDVFDGRVNVRVGPDGSVRSLGSRLYIGPGGPVRVAIAPAEALARAVADVYPSIAPTTSLISEDDDPMREAVFDGTGFAFPPRLRLIWFPTADGFRLAWEIRIAEPSLITSYRMLVDAVDGSLLYRKNTTWSADARYLNGNQPSPETEEFVPNRHVLGTIPSSTAESPQGWISGDGTSLEGNNARSHLGYYTDPGLSDPLGAYDYAYNTQSSALTNAWWWTNDAHDRFYALGFDEVAGNYQTDNFGKGGVEGDPIEVTVFAAGKRDNAFFSPTSADGGIGAILLMWSSCRFCGDHDGYPETESKTAGERSTAFMRDLIFHEYSHGVTNRMVGGPADGSCLSSIQAEAMGEGWGDLFASSFTGNPRFWAHFMEGYGWTRGLENDTEYGDFCAVGDSMCQEHDDGMIWGAILWELRESMRGLDPTSGVDDFERIVVEALKSTPCQPTMVDGRDAILDADTTLFGSAHHDPIWNTFAARGIGESASSDGGTSPVTDTTVPAAHVCTAPDVPTGLTAAPDGDNGIRLDYSAAGASAVEVWRENVDNPFDRPVRIAFATDTSTFVDRTVQGGKSYRYHLLALGSGGSRCASAASATADATATGSCDAYPVFDPDLTIVEDDGSCGLTLSWNPAGPGCPGSGSGIVYSVYRAPTPGFEASDRLLIGRTIGTTLSDVPPATVGDPFYREFGRTHYYLVLAQHGILDDPPDHRERGSSQILEWVPGLPTGARATVEFWDFDDGTQGWTADNTNDPSGGWTAVDPNPTTYAGALLAPDEAAGGSGMAWVTGDAGGPSSATEFDCDGLNFLTSPTWDGTGGATILSFDQWSHVFGNFWAGMEARIDNGVDPVVRVGVTGLMTAQSFETDGRHGWQRHELDLADHVAPTSTMLVTFATFCAWPFGEFGIDNVRVESATSCSRSGLVLDSVAVDDSPPGWGNGNGVLEPGETAGVTVTVRNEGAGTAFAANATMSTVAPGTLVHDETAAFPDVAAGATASATSEITVTLPSDVDCAGTVVFDLEFVDAAGTVSTAVWNPETGYAVTETVFEDDFETDKGWLPDNPLFGRGRWERGDPVGTMDGSNQANPEDDSPNDAGSQCWVTQNGSPGGDKNATDVDTQSTLESPLLDLSGYKRSRMRVDLWFYDNSTGDVTLNEGEYGALVDDGAIGSSGFRSVYETTGGWVEHVLPIHEAVPMTADVRVYFRARDRLPDETVEMGVDNVRIEGDLGTCDPLGVDLPPNGIGDTLRVSKTGSEADLSWAASPADGTHDGAAYYELWVSGSPDVDFAIADTTTGTAHDRIATADVEYYRVSAVNPAGTSGDEPAP
jgi:hypothetical protein